jgi:hypothetical protein
MNGAAGVAAMKRERGGIRFVIDGKLIGAIGGVFTQDAATSRAGLAAVTAK